MLVACQSTYGQFYQYDKFILTESDKQLHFAAGAIATTVGYEWALKKYKGNKKKAFFVGVGVGLGVGVVVGFGAPSQSMVRATRNGRFELRSMEDGYRGLTL